MEQGDSLIVMDNKPKKTPPARFAAKLPASTDDIPIKPAMNMDDMPIGGSKGPLLTTMGEDEDRPLPKGTYDLDKLLGAEAFADPNGDVLMNDVSTRPKKAPPARLAAKKPVQTSNEDIPLKPAKNLDDMPIGGAK